MVGRHRDVDTLLSVKGFQTWSSNRPTPGPPPTLCVCVCVRAVSAVTSFSHQAALSTEPIPTIGLRRPLGSDMRRRRYWVLGGASGAWRVFCEEVDSCNWVRALCRTHTRTHTHSCLLAR
jgi:hypothetical protein